MSTQRQPLRWTKIELNQDRKDLRPCVMLEGNGPVRTNAPLCFKLSVLHNFAKLSLGDISSYCSALQGSDWSALQKEASEATLLL